MSSPTSKKRFTSTITGRSSIHANGRESSPLVSSPQSPQRSHPSSDDETDSPELPLNTDNESSSRTRHERTCSPQRHYEKIETITIKIKRREQSLTGSNSSGVEGASVFNKSDIFDSSSNDIREKLKKRSQSKKVEQVSQHRSRSSSRRRYSHYTAESSTAKQSAASTPWSCIAVVAVLVAVAYIVFGRDTIPEPKYRHCHDFERLKKAFPHQENYIWKALKTGIEGVINNRPPKPSIFLFLHHDDNSAETIIKNIVDTAAVCFDPSLKVVNLAIDDIKSNDPGVLIERYKEVLNGGGVALISDLNNISVPAARALHFICDSESPIFDNVVIFLTLKALALDGNPIEVAEDTLNTLWQADIDNNTLSAIVARITDQVLLLRPE